MPVAVFLVEDMLHLRAVVVDLLKTLGDFVVVGEAGTEAEAKLWLEQNPGRWDLAVIDLILEQGTGMGVIPRCKDLPNHGKVVVFSDYATPGIRKHCMALGADAVFPKSSEVAGFIAYCNALLRPSAAGPTAPPM